MISGIRTSTIKIVLPFCAERRSLGSPTQTLSVRRHKRRPVKASVVCLAAVSGGLKLCGTSSLLIGDRREVGVGEDNTASANRFFSCRRSGELRTTKARRRVNAGRLRAILIRQATGFDDVFRHCGAYLRHPSVASKGIVAEAAWVRVPLSRIG